MLALAQINWGRVFAWGIILLCVAASIGYFFARDYRKSAYWFFSACITTTVTVSKL